ncbi:hypothetical protein KSP40_PGU006384 [Platanthera guangdongensis]|uniref:FAR1 domain-containing protein n=1 Tax=Platanthera guangdongensis TaxID=2320717 RepID=A0ABR2LFH3_9ASPA
MDGISGPTKNPRRARIIRQDLNNSQVTAMDSSDMEFADGDPNFDNSNVSGGYEGVLEVGTVFKTHHEVSKFYKSYARRVGFGVSVRRSSFSKEGLSLYLELMCCKGGGNKRAEHNFHKRTGANSPTFPVTCNRMDQNTPTKSVLGCKVPLFCN